MKMALNERYGKEIITKKQADEIIKTYDEKTKQLMIDNGLEVGNTPYADEARREKHEFLYERLKSIYIIKD